MKVVNATSITVAIQYTSNIAIAEFARVLGISGDKADGYALYKDVYSENLLIWCQGEYTIVTPGCYIVKNDSGFDRFTKMEFEKFYKVVGND